MKTHIIYENTHNIDVKYKVEVKYMNVVVQDQIEQAVQKIITAIGEDPQRNGLKKTPYRVAKMYQELLHKTMHSHTGSDALL